LSDPATQLFVERPDCLVRLAVREAPHHEHVRLARSEFHVSDFDFDVNDLSHVWALPVL
jgi:hypothetical protein